MPFTRLASIEDHPAVEKIDEWHDASPQVIASGRCVVAGRGNEIEAYAITSTWFGGKPFVEVVFVTAVARRSGLASLLLAAIEESQSNTRLWITTGLQNVSMQNLLHKRGYELCGTIEKLARTPELVYSRAVV